MDHYRTGSFTQAATAVAVNIAVGFKPTRVIVHNKTDRTFMEWNDQMTSGTALVNAAAGTRTLIAANGITPITGDQGTVQGFTFGKDTAGVVNLASKAITWEAHR